jgi:hypothetical protein
LIVCRRPWAATGWFRLVIVSKASDDGGVEAESLQGFRDSESLVLQTHMTVRYIPLLVGAADQGADHIHIHIFSRRQHLERC